MLRRPRAALATTTLPALAALLGACQREAPRYPPPPPPPDPPALPPAAQDAGGVTSLEPTLIDPRNLPPMPMGGAPVVVSPVPSLGFGGSSALPPPSHAPSHAPRPAPAPAAAPAAAPTPEPALPPEQTAMRAITAAEMPLASLLETSGLEPGVYLLHRHAPGTPCRPVSRTEVEQVAAGARPMR